MKEEEGATPAPVAAAAAAAATPGASALAEMNAAFAKCLALVSPPIQYPPHCRLNPVQQDAADTLEVETRLEEFFVHAKQLELLFLGDAAAEAVAALDLNADAGAGSAGTATMESRATLKQRQSELELEILHLEAELAEKNDMVEKYSDVVRGWEGKFKRLEHRLTPGRE